MRRTVDPRDADVVRQAARPLVGAVDDYDALLEVIGDARFVLLGEASHGTREFYGERARITRRLIAEKGFDAVAIEGDWPDAYRLNRYVRGAGDSDAVDALAGFRRFPTWMWRNREVVEFLRWQRAFNGARPAAVRSGFYGLDLYSLHSSMAAVLGYLDDADPAAARLARERYGCLDRFAEDGQRYGLMTGLGAEPSCEEEVIAMLVDLRRRAAAAVEGGDLADEEQSFDAEQNARVVKNAEQYYRSMYLGDVSSWNLRDTHMADTLDALERHLGRRRARPRIVVWAHNSHLGDARATEMGERRGELNVGQLVRERHGDEAVLVGFTSHQGSVTAASEWDAPAKRMRILPSRADSHEGLFHAAGLARFMLPLRDPALSQVLGEPRLERAIGVIYRPETERQSHYFSTRLREQFDAVIHIDESHAVEPLERNVEWQGGELPETYPRGL